MLSSPTRFMPVASGKSQIKQTKTAEAFAQNATAKHPAFTAQDPRTARQDTVQFGTTSTPQTKENIQAFHRAASDGDIEKLDEMLKNGMNIDQKDNDGLTALMNASLNQQWDMVNFLLEKKANKSLIAPNGFSALLYAIEYEAQQDVIAKLEPSPMSLDQTRKAICLALLTGDEDSFRKFFEPLPDKLNEVREGIPLMAATLLNEGIYEEDEHKEIKESFKLYLSEYKDTAQFPELFQQPTPGVIVHFYKRQKKGADLHTALNKKRKAQELNQAIDQKDPYKKHKPVQPSPLGPKNSSNTENQSTAGQASWTLTENDNPTNNLD